MEETDPLQKFKKLANMRFNPHGGRRGTRSATSIVAKMLSKEGDKQSSARPGPTGMGVHTPYKGSKMHNPNATTFTHLHQMHEKYNEK